MTEPLALVLYEKLLPGTQLVNRLQDLKYRVHTLHKPDQLPDQASQLKPMIVIADLGTGSPEMAAAVAQLRRTPDTQHIPVLGFCSDAALESLTAASPEGVTLLVGEAAILNHLPQLLEHALRVD